MTARRDPDRLIRTFLDDGPTELADRSYDAVRAEIDHTRQRAVIGPWREPDMSKFAPFAIAAAAVLVVAAVAFNLTPPPGQFGGPGPGPTASPTAAPTPTPSPSPTAAAVKVPASGELNAAAYYIDDRTITNAERFTFTVPDGWTIDNGFLTKEGEEPGEVLLVTWVVTHIFSDACQWDEGALVDVGTTVDQLASALADQRGREASAPTDVTLGGFPAKRIELTVDPDLDVTTCTNGNLRYWPGAGPDMTSGLCCNPPGNTDVVYIVDVAGSRLVVVARHYPGSSAENRAELQAVVDSIQIEP